MPTFYWVTRAPRLLQVSSENLRHRFRGAAPLLGPLAPTLTAVLLRVKAESLQQTMTLTVSVASTIAVRVRISNSILNSSQFMSVSDAQVLSWSILNISKNSWPIWPQNIEGNLVYIVITPSVYNLVHRSSNRWCTTTRHLCTNPVQFTRPHAKFSADRSTTTQHFSREIQQIFWLVYRATILLLCYIGSLHHQPITHHVSCI